jgi:hypothetical protein
MRRVIKALDGVGMFDLHPTAAVQTFKSACVCVCERERESERERVCERECQDIGDKDQDIGDMR